MKPQNQQQTQTPTRDPQTLQSLHDVQAGIQRLRALAQDLSAYRDYLSALSAAHGERLGWDAPETQQLERRIADAETQRARALDRAAQLEAALDAASTPRSA